MGDGRSAADTTAEDRLLRRVIETITSSPDLDAVVTSTIDLVLEATGGDACFLHLWDPERRRLVLTAASPPFDAAVGRVTLALGEGIAGWVAANRQSVSIPEGKFDDPRYKYIPELGGEQFTSMISVPVISRSDELVGVFNVHSHARRDFDQRALEFVRLTASLVAEAVERGHLFRALAEKERVLQGLVRKTVEAQEEERRRVATEIHDGVSQQLVSVWYRLEAGRRHLRSDVDRAERELGVAQSLLDEALTEARMAIHDLRPSVLDDLGLAPSLRALAFRGLEGLDLDLDLPDAVGLPPHQEVALYRIAQETFTNIRKHAAARRVRVSLRETPSHFELRITDDGAGFDPGARPAGPQTSFGLTGMVERTSLIGGAIDIRSEPGKGTTVAVAVPKHPAEAAS